MQKLRVKKHWIWAGLLLALVLLGVSAGVGSAIGRAGRAAEIVYDRPLRAVSQPVDGDTAAAAQPAGAGGAPRASLPETFFDFGSIPAQGPVEHDFLLRNQGDAPLLIRQAYTTCGCTSADFTASVIPPGKASRVTVRFDPGFHAMAGQTVRRGLIVESNDPLHPQVEIWVQASVK